MSNLDPRVEAYLAEVANSRHKHIGTANTTMHGETITASSFGLIDGDWTVRIDQNEVTFFTHDAVLARKLTDAINTTVALHRAAKVAAMFDAPALEAAE